MPSPPPKKNSNNLQTGQWTITETQIPIDCLLLSIVQPASSEAMRSNPDGIPSYEELKAQAEEEIAEDRRSAWPSGKQVPSPLSAYLPRYLP